MKNLIKLFILSASFLLFISPVAGQAKVKQAIQIAVDSAIKKIIVGKSIFIDCKIINNSDNDINIPYSFLINDYNYKEIAPDEIGAMVCYKNDNEKKFKKKNIRKETTHYNSNLKTKIVKSNSIDNFLIEIPGGDIEKIGFYKMRFQFKRHKLKKPVWSNWLFLEVISE